MKRKMFGLVVIVLCFILVGCGTADKAVIVNNDGETENKSYDELNELFSQNNEYFRKHYDGAKITITDTVESIKKDSFIYDIDAYVYELNLSSGWVVYIDQNQNDLSDILTGTKVKINSYIHDNDYWPIIHGTYGLNNGQNAHYGLAHETSDTSIEIVK